MRKISIYTNFIDFTKLFHLLHTWHKQIKHNSNNFFKKVSLALFTLQKLCCAPTGLGVLYSRQDHHGPSGSMHHLDSDPFIPGNHTSSMEAAVHQISLCYVQISLNKKRP